MEESLIFIGVAMFFWSLLMGEPDHWDAFERFGAKYGPLIGLVIFLIGCVI